MPADACLVTAGARRENFGGDLASLAMLFDQHVDVPRRRTARLLYLWKDVFFFQLLLVIVLAERLHQGGRALQRRKVDLAAPAQPPGTGAIDENRTADDAVLAHQIFDSADIAFLFGATSCGQKQCTRARCAQQHQAPVCFDPEHRTFHLFAPRPEWAGVQYKPAARCRVRTVRWTRRTARAARSLEVVRGGPMIHQGQAERSPCRER